MNSLLLQEPTQPLLPHRFCPPFVNLQRLTVVQVAHSHFLVRAQDLLLSLQLLLRNPFKAVWLPDMNRAKYCEWKHQFTPQAIWNMTLCSLQLQSIRDNKNESNSTTSTMGIKVWVMF